MPIYHRMGKTPAKRHVAFRREGGGLYHEQLMGNRGFAGISSLFYHLRRPTAVARTRMLRRVELQPDPDPTLRMRHFRLGRLPEEGSATIERHPVLFNADVALSLARPDHSDTFLFRNATADEVIFVTEGEGTLESICGELDYRSGDFVVIPRGITYRLRLGETRQMLLAIETAGDVRTPARYRNAQGQLLEHSPYCERDIRRPDRLPVHDEPRESTVMVKSGAMITEVVLDHHPFDVVGWDGFYYPWALSVHDFEPIVGRVHQPPPVHQIFEAANLVICAFVPRLYDFHPEAIPAPYNHANAMSDEVLFYARDRFMSRKGIELASLTLHPDGLTHGPHPGTAEASIGSKETDELAVMVDTFRPLQVAKAALTVEDKEYGQSWLD